MTSKNFLEKIQDLNVEKDKLEEEDLDLKKVINETQKTNQTGSSDNLEKSISDILNKR